MFIKRSDISFRLAEKADVEEIVVLINKVYAEKDKSVGPNISYRKEGEIGNRTDAKDILNKITSPSFHFYIAIDNNRKEKDQIVATQCIEFKKSSKKECRGELTLFAVHQEYRGKNLGCVFSKYIETELKSRVAEILSEVVAEQGSLIEYYKEQGFFLTGTLDYLKSEKFKRGEITLIQMIKPLKGIL